jgi:hypothetical protein
MSGSATPVWPTPRTAHYYLRRYFVIGQGGKAWSYDGFLAYFLWLLQPAAAYITNHAKCFLGRSGGAQPKEVFDTCATQHLRWEITSFQPNVILSLTSRVRSRDVHELPFSLPEDTVVLSAYHPEGVRSSNSRRKKAKYFADSLHANRQELSALGYNVRRVCESWKRHSRLAIRG